MRVRPTLAWTGLLAVLGCVPQAGGGSGTQGDASQDDETTTQDASSTDPEPKPDPGTEPEPEPDPETGTTQLFVPEFDLTGCECDPFAQDCPEGEKCVAYFSSAQSVFWDANLCVPVTGSKTSGEPCIYTGPVDAGDDCDQDSACWNAHDVDGELLGTCRAFCNGTADNPLCAEGTSCATVGEGSVTLCLPPCDPLTQDCDASDCHFAGLDFACLPASTKLGLAQSCRVANECAAGLTCVGATLVPDCGIEGKCCTTYCDVTAQDGPCDAIPGTSCVPFFDPDAAPLGYEHIGVCITA